MASLSYETIYSAFLRKITDYSFLCDSVDEVKASLAEYLHSTISRPYTRRLFGSVSFDDTLEEMTFDMAYSTNEEQDTDFVTEVLALGMVIEWTKPMLNSRILQQQMITSSKESKFYSQAMHITELRGLLEDTKKEQRDFIRDRNYFYNKYLGGSNGQA